MSWKCKHSLLLVSDLSHSVSLAAPRLEGTASPACHSVQKKRVADAGVDEGLRVADDVGIIALVEHGLARYRAEEDLLLLALPRFGRVEKAGALDHERGPTWSNAMESGCAEHDRCRKHVSAK